MIVLGSTGSIGVNALNIAREEALSINALSCGENIRLLNEQIAEFNPDFVCVKNKEDVRRVNHKRVFYGEEGILKLLSESEDELVINALVGFAGLKASFKTQELGKVLALANKESLVVGGRFLDCEKILPIDSEHSALKELMRGDKKPKKLYITASGGAFYKTPLDELKNVTAKDALKHPSWSMGDKITIDSATMMNKLFELLEAFWLYKSKNIEAIIESSSTVHALCEYEDNSFIAHLSQPDMKLCLALAILGDDKKSFIRPLDLLKMKALEFKEIKKEKYPLYFLKDLLFENPDLGVVINAANEVLVSRFLRGKIGFLDIQNGVFKTLEKYGDTKIKEASELFELNKEISLYTGEL